MTIAVLGLGGVGGMLAARTGALCIGTERTVAAIRARGGITLVEDGVTTVAHVEAVERLEVPVSLLVVAVKAPALADALERIAPSAIAGAVVLPLLNGLEHVELIREQLDGRRVTARSGEPVVVAGSIGRLEAFSPEPGFVIQRTTAAVITAASRDLSQEALSASLTPLRVRAVEVVIGGDEQAVLWEKAARLAVLAAATTASGETVGVLRSESGWRKRLDVALDETCAVARAAGVPLDPAAQWEIIDAMPGTLTTSTARDVAAGRPSELDAITGSVVRAGRMRGIVTAELESLLAEAEARCPRA